MTLTILSLVVLVQVIVFQIITTLGIRALLRHELKAVDGPEFEQVRVYANKAPRFRLLLGVILAGWAVLCALGALIEPGPAKIILAGVSLVSSVAFAMASIHDRKLMRVFVDQLPGGSVRRASLERRSLGLWYHPLLEAIPVAIFVGTSLFMWASVGPNLAEGVPQKALWYLGLQGVLVVGALSYSYRRGTSVTSVATRLPTLRHDPEMALELSEQLAVTEMRYFMFAKIAVSALLGSIVIESCLAAIGHSSATFFDVFTWVMVGLLLIAFAVYLRKVIAISRDMNRQMESADSAVVS